jgi:hypothetical protein
VKVITHRKRANFSLAKREQVKNTRNSGRWDNVALKLGGIM